MNYTLIKPFEESKSIWIQNLQHRCLQILQLKIIEHIKPKQVIIRYNKTNVYEKTYDEETESKLIKEFGPSFVTQELDYKDFFNYMLQKCGYSSVLNHIDVNEKNINLDITYNDETENLLFEDKYYDCLYEGIIFQNDYILSKEPDTIYEIIEYLKPQFETFIETYKDATIIDHSVFVEWLISLFPTMIQIRKLD